MRERGTGKLSAVCVIIVFAFLGVAVWIENAGIPEYNTDVFVKRIETELQYDMISQMFPLWGYAGSELWEKELPADAEYYLAEMPFYQYAYDEMEMTGAVDNGDMFVQMNETEKSDVCYF